MGERPLEGDSHLVAIVPESGFQENRYRDSCGLVYVPDCLHYLDLVTSRFDLADCWLLLAETR